MEKSMEDANGPQRIDFPPMPPLPEFPRGQRVPLATNSFTLAIRTSTYIYVYSAKFGEDVPANNTPLRREIVRGLQPELAARFKNYLFAGAVLYSPTDLGTAPLVCTHQAGEGRKYRVEFQRAHTLCVTDILSAHKDPAKAQTAMTFLNMIVKNLLNACNMYPVGRTKKYLLPSAVKKIPDYPIEVWPGFYTSVNLCQKGLLLEIDYSSRILRQESVFEYIRHVQKGRPEGWKEAVKEGIVGHSVLARYGNKQTYVVSDIDFELTPETYQFNEGENKTSILDYFRRKYLIDIKVRDQPLILSVKKQRDGKEQKTYLVPELCSLTGLPEELREDRFALKQFSVYTKLTPDQRIQEAKRLLSSFSSVNRKTSRGAATAPEDKKESVVGTFMASWNMDLAMEPNEIFGRVLLPQEIAVGGGKIIRVPESGQFFFRERVSVPLAMDKWILVHTDRDQSTATTFLDVLYKAAQTFGIVVDYPEYATSRGIKARDFIDALGDAMGRIKDPQIVVFILPPPSAAEYAMLKKFAAAQSPPLLTQMIKAKTLGNQKNLMAVCSKIVLQMNAKRNGDLWKVRVPVSLPRKTMVVGIDISKEGKFACMGFASSYDPGFAKYYTQIMHLQSKQEINTAIGGLLVRALEKFYRETNKKFMPELIVVYRDGLCETQRTAMLVAELQSMMRALGTKFPEYKPKLTYATVHKKIHTRFFAKGGDFPRRSGGERCVLCNPRPGTVVDSGIVDSKKYEFLIMPQYVNEGTGTPARISVLFDTSGLGIEAFEELTNALCYGYFNWQGAIRTPAPCKYAFSHARLISKYVQTLPAEQLLPFVYFL